MFYVLQTFNAKSFQVVQTTRRNFAAFYGKILFECQENYLAQTVLKTYQQSDPPKHFASRFSHAQLAKIRKRHLHIQARREIGQ